MHDGDDNQVLPIRLMAVTNNPFLVIFSHLPLVCDFGWGLGWGEPGTSPVSTIIVYKVVSSVEIFRVRKSSIE